MTVYDANQPNNQVLGMQQLATQFNVETPYSNIALLARVSIGDGQEGFDRPISTNPSETYSLQWEILI
jgi:hypothetical protein